MVLLMVTLILVVALLWPMPQLATPSEYDGVLIRSINIIDVETGDILENRDVLIEDHKIARIDSTKITLSDAVSLQIDGAGKFLIPGLWDMHTHSTQHSAWLHHPLYIANGVTVVRDMSGQLDRRDSYWVGSNERLVWNSELEENIRVTPRYVMQSSYQMDGAASVPEGFPGFFKLEHLEDVDSLLRFYQSQQVDFIKVYQQLLPNTYEQLAKKAPEYGLHIAGHKPAFISLENATIWGQRSFEHGRIFMFECFPGAEGLRTSKEWKKFYSNSKRSMVEDFDAEKAKNLMTLMQKHNAHWVPTLQTLKFEAFAHESAFVENPNLRYITSIRKKLWWGMDRRKNAERNTTGKNRGLSETFYEASKRQIKMANDIGVPIMTGTDVTDSYIFPGFSLHDELQELTKSGLSNLEALQAATIVPAKYAEQEDLYGKIAVGKAADLIILDNNPLRDIAHTQTIQGVILNGLYYDKKKIEQLKTFTASNASSFHVNIKVLFSLINSPLIRVQFAD